MPAAAAVRDHCALATRRVRVWPAICSDCSATALIEAQRLSGFFGRVGRAEVRSALGSDRGRLRAAVRGPLVGPSDPQILSAPPEERIERENVVDDQSARLKSSDKIQLTRLVCRELLNS